jgi:phosphatidylglycerophosphate synthase
VTGELGILVGVIALLVLSMLAYARTPGGRATQDRTGRGGTFFLGYWVRNWFYWLIRPLVSMSIAIRLHPLVVNVIAVLLGVASMGFFIAGMLPWAGWMILISGFADVMDGEVARGREMANRSGAFLDSTLDRFSELAAFVGIGAFFGSGFPVVAVLVALGGSLLVSYTRARGESLEILCKGGLMQRAERILLLGVGSIVDPSLSRVFGHPPGFVLAIIVSAIALGTVGTAIYRTIWISRRLQAK